MNFTSLQRNEIVTGEVINKMLYLQVVVQTYLSTVVVVIGFATICITQ